MPRSLASATISFGLVSIPVRLFSATQPSAGLSFNLLHGKCGSRVRQQYVCPTDGEKVERDDMVKGWEFASGQYVTFTAEELRALEETSSQAIEIAEFVPLDAVDPVYFDKPYYLGPDRGAAKAYRLLAEALRRSGKAALARYAARGKGYLVLLRAAGDRLVMQQLLHADEVRSAADVEVEEASVRDNEVELALRLVEQTASDSFHPERYPDEVRARVQALIDRKVEGKQIQVAPSDAPRAQVIDLVDALRASLAAAGTRAARAADPAPRAAEPAPATPGASDAATAAPPPAARPRRASARPPRDDRAEPQAAAPRARGRAGGKR
jgi:DNA end-binding protein Ku